MSSIKRVVLVGANGVVGAPVLQELLKNNYDVTVFTRPSSTHKFPSNVQVLNVDYEDVAGLTKALQNQDALISTIGFGGAPLQKNLVDAAIAAGVKRFLPSEYGCDTENKRVRVLPIFPPKLEVVAYLEEKTKGTATSYTCVMTNAFLDWGLVNFGLLLDLPAKKIQRWDGGDAPVTANSVDFIARGIVSVLQHLDETKNRAVRLNDAVITQNQLLAYAKKYAGEDGWEIEEVNGEAMEKEAYANLKTTPENPNGYLLHFIKRAIYGAGFGGNFEHNNDNEVLGLKQKTDAEVEQLVKGLVKRSFCREVKREVIDRIVSGEPRWVHLRPTDEERKRAFGDYSVLNSVPYDPVNGWCVDNSRFDPFSVRTKSENRRSDSSLEDPLFGSSSKPRVPESNAFGDLFGRINASAQDRDHFRMVDEVEEMEMKQKEKSHRLEVEQRKQFVKDFERKKAREMKAPVALRKRVELDALAKHAADSKLNAPAESAAGSVEAMPWQTMPSLPLCAPKGVDREQMATPPLPTSGPKEQCHSDRVLDADWEMIEDDESVDESDWVLDGEGMAVPETMALE
ncbi:hypothetical protein LTR56_018542 [Elasticomyces elasticus]|nr:hypothetical protein LTR56_018542 [Elasticomyces elasticus]KAK3660235.1 hypothetical protein LTR22_008060 [Elasticomyces elasticus]KAK4933693.1 hypothetical protein LTR49_000158 [Elasticomyces elasticus]KAK5761616.1 hypothetical protein LTS12_008220 [Elasticomyces elasticus]